MCGIVAFHGPRSDDALRLVERCLLQAAMRGTHATGIAWLQEVHPDEWQLCMERAPVSARDFVEHYDFSRIAEGEETTLSIVAHTRYSTSDLDWNQPLADDELALVMNGVISQDVPAAWPLAELQPYSTGNDAEVAMRYARLGRRGRMPGSFAVVELWNDGRVLAYRNAYRPLYQAEALGGVLVASTLDMLRRCDLSGRMLPPGVVHDIGLGDQVVEKFPVTPDTQPEPRDPRSLRCPTE